MSTPIVPATNTGGAGGTLMGGTNILQTSIDTLNTSVTGLITSIGTLSTSIQNQRQTATAQQQGGGGFPGISNPFSNNPNTPGMGGGGPGGAGNVNQPTPFSSVIAGTAGVGSAIAGYGNQQLPTQLALNAYATQAALAGGQTSSNFTQQYKLAFGYQNQGLNFLSSSPSDALAGTQMLNYAASNPNYRNTSIGRAGFGYTAAVGMSNPLASMQSGAGFAQSMLNPQTSQTMMALGYPVTPRQMGTGQANLPANVIQGMLRAWYGQKDINPSTLTAGLGLGGRANLNLSALGIDPTTAAPMIEEYNQLFRKGLSPTAAQKLINQASSGTLSSATAAQKRLESLGVSTATSEAQKMRNGQAILTGRDANIASGFSRGLSQATGLLSKFNEGLSHLMTTLHLNGLVGWSGGFGSIMSGTNKGNVLLGGSSLAGAIGGLLGLSSGGIIPGYSPGKDDVPAKLSHGEAVLNPGAALALGHSRINALNAMHSPPGAKTQLSSGVLNAAAGFGGNGVYRNPFRSVSGLTPERVDMGVDYGGSGPVYAMGPGVVTNTSQSWKGAQGAPYPGYFISYKFTGGPDKGKYVYVAEDIWPSVRVGQQVNSNTIIGRMKGGIETGWAAPPGSGNTMAAVSGEASPSGDPGSVSTAYGANFNALLRSLGVPAGKQNSMGLGGVSGGSSTPTSSITGNGTVGGIGFSESSLIPNTSELSALSGGFAGGNAGGGTMGSPTSNGTSSRPSNNGGFSSVSGLGGNASQNRALMKRLASKFGWGSGDQWRSLDTLEMHEAGYNQNAQNPTSTAYGIGQFLDSTWAGFGPKTSNARLQEIYMLEYIKQRYKNPVNAWDQYYAHPGGVGWYGAGGTLTGGISIVGDRGPEAIVGGAGSKVLDNASTMKLINSNPQPAQSPWSNLGAVGKGTSPSNALGPINLNFTKESVVIKVDHQTADASFAGREAAKGFIKYLKDEELFDAIGIGEKNNYGQ